MLLEPSLQPTGVGRPRAGLLFSRLCRCVWTLGLLATTTPRVLADPPAAQVTPDTPSATPPPAANPSGGAFPEIPIIPGYGPGDALPFGPLSPDTSPRMDLIPNGMTPLTPQPSVPNQDLGASTPLVTQAPQNVDLKTLKYKISKVTVKYGGKQPPNPRLPLPQVLTQTPVLLGEAPAAVHEQGGLVREDQSTLDERYGGLVGPGAGVRDIPVSLAQISTPETFSGDALQAIYTSIVAQLNKRGIYGVFVVVDPDQINPSTGEDLRKGGTELTLLVYASEVRLVRTIVKPVAKPPFKVPSTRLDDPKYRKITAHSPLLPPFNGTPGSLLQQAALQDYIDRINRFPGRRVDVAITASGEDAGVILDYIVHVETPPVFLFSQTSNTGTQASGTWRTRVGAELRQLAGLDDTLDVSYETSLSSSTYSAFGSYQITPIFPDYLKLKAYGGYGRFTAEDVGFDEANFVGDSTTAGLLAIYTPYYFKGFPIDVVAGVEYKDVSVTNVGAFAETGKTNFLLPIVGLATDRTTELYSVLASVQFEPNLPGVIGTNNSELQNMGRFDVDRNFLIGRYNFGGSFFLEPLLFRGRWRDYEAESDPAKRKKFWPVLTEAHEFSLLVHGQYTFADKRLVPQFEDVIGGFASVRGYPEAFTSGDDTIIANAEYRLHVLRLFKPRDTDAPADPAKAPPAPRFSLRPPTILGRPDLDLTLRLFYDYGYAENNRLVESLEANRTLMSTGVGAEVQILRYVNLRLDCGFPLTTITDKTSRPVEAGSPRLSFVAVLSY